MDGNLSMNGRLRAVVIRSERPGLGWLLRNWLRWSQIKSLIGVFLIRPLARRFGLTTAYGTLRAVLIRGDGTRVNYGVLSYRVVTTAFVDFVTDQLQTETSVFGDFKFHDSGVGTTDPAIGDTTIETTDGESRVAGTQTESAHNVYQSAATISYSADKAITEHGLFNDASAGTLMDRSEFAAINVVGGSDSILFTYSLTLSPGG